MANATSSQILVDGPLHTVVKFDGVLDTSNLAPTVVVDPSVQYIDPTAPTTKYRIDKIWYSVQAPLAVQLQWDGAVPVRIVDLSGASFTHLGQEVGGYQNNVGAGITGKILAITNGWNAGTLAFTITLDLKKQ